MSTSTMLLLGGGLVLYYLLVLRRYNSLGFRLFSLITMVTVMLAWLIRQDEKRLSSLATHGQRVIATIVSKEKAKGGAPNAVTVLWKDAAGSEVVKQASEYVSDPEWEAFAVHAPVEILYDGATKEAYVVQSLERFRGDKWVLYAGTGVFFLIGCGCWFFLRKHKVGVDAEGNEWVEKDGRVMLDERRSPSAQAMKRANMVWKLLRLFGGK